MSNRIVEISRVLPFCVVLLGLHASALEKDSKALQPVLLEKSYQRGENLEGLAPWPSETIVHPLAKHSFVRWYVGGELTSMIYEASDGVIRLNNLSYDEHSRVLNG